MWFISHQNASRRALRTTILLIFCLKLGRQTCPPGAVTPSLARGYPSRSLKKGWRNLHLIYKFSSDFIQWTVPNLQWTFYLLSWTHFKSWWCVTIEAYVIINKLLIINNASSAMIYSIYSTNILVIISCELLSESFSVCSNCIFLFVKSVFLLLFMIWNICQDPSQICG